MVEESTEKKGATGASTGLPTKFQAPGHDGQLGILPQHTRYLAVLGVGEMAYRIDDAWQGLAMARGLMEVEGDRVIILAQTAELADSARRKGLPIPSPIPTSKERRRH